ncbi:MAG: 3'-5' exonuclease, partial [Atopobiaceae bacterium]|nr:3'-5' exonuclease [Atopobiaceae bacterium]
RLEAQGAEGAAREANVLAAVRYIRDLTDELGLGPSRAAAEFAHWLEVSKIPPASLAGSERDTVRVMTIHASKGLEYPVVAVAECWNNPRRDAGVWSASSGDGAKTVVVVPAGGVKVDDMSEDTLCDDLASLAYDVCTRNADDDAQEKARLLYVALTRAREALVLAMSASIAKTGMSSDLAAGVSRALFGGDMPELPPAGLCSVDYGGTEPALVRHVALTREKYDPVVIDDGGAMPSLFADDKVGAAAGLPGGPREVAGPADGPHAVAGLPDGPREVALYPMEQVSCTTARTVRAREDVFSYSSALAGLEPHEPDARSRQPKLPPREEREAESAGEPRASDEDKATSLGSAFHMIAQTMVQTGTDPSPDRVEALCRRWNLSTRQRVRLDAALERWCASDLRKEALSWNVVRAEVPFFALSGGSPHGAYVEGAIDLLCTTGTACEGPALVVDYKTGDIGLSQEQVHARHAAQAELYASVLLSLGFSHVECAFFAVETGIIARY